LGPCIVSICLKVAIIYIGVFSITDKMSVEVCHEIRGLVLVFGCFLSILQIFGSILINF
jgi:hypothetical protein